MSQQEKFAVQEQGEEQQKFGWRRQELKERKKIS